MQPTVPMREVLGTLAKSLWLSFVVSARPHIALSAGACLGILMQRYDLGYAACAALVAAGWAFNTLLTFAGAMMLAHRDHKEAQERLRIITKALADARQQDRRPLN